MKLLKKANKTIVKMSFNEWSSLGKKANWLEKEAGSPLIFFIYRLKESMAEMMLQDPSYSGKTADELKQMLGNMTLNDLTSLAEKYDVQSFG